MSAALGLSPFASSLIGASTAILRDDGPAFIAHIKAQDWGALALDVVTAELKLAASIPGPQMVPAGMALKLLPVAIYMARHPHNSGEDGIGAPPEGASNIAL
ncbi:MAG: hypothetical protein KGL39_35035 [Patescibacteria group bacterium]|nr:hypothetical protein [Patescibacteria group bacterium]